jgi:hypothetical protein
MAHMNAGHPSTLHTPANEHAVTAAVGQEPWRSSCDNSQDMGLSHPRVPKVLHDDQLHPCYYSRNAHLFPDDCPLWMQYYEWLRHQHHG